MVANREVLHSAERGIAQHARVIAHPERFVFAWVGGAVTRPFPIAIGRDLLRLVFPPVDKRILCAVLIGRDHPFAELEVEVRIEVDAPQAEVKAKPADVGCVAGFAKRLVLASVESGIVSNPIRVHLGYRGVVGVRQVPFGLSVVWVDTVETGVVDLHGLTYCVEGVSARHSPEFSPIEELFHLLPIVVEH